MKVLPLLLLFVSFLSTSWSQDVWLGMEKSLLVEALGNPVSSVASSSREILLFENGAEIFLMEGKVYQVDGMPFLQLPPANKQRSLLPKPEPASSVPERATDDVTPPRSPQPEQQPTKQPLKQPDNTPADSVAADPYTDFLEYDTYSYDESYETERDPLREGFISFMIECVVSFVILKMGFAMFGFPIMLRQLALIAVVQSGAHVLCFSLGALSDLVWMFKIDRALSYCSLVAAIYVLSDVKQVITALKIAAMTKVATFIVTFLVFMLLVQYF